MPSPAVEGVENAARSARRVSHTSHSHYYCFNRESPTDSAGEAFRRSDIQAILLEPLVIGLAERPILDLSDERSAIALTSIVSSSGGTSADAGKYQKWLSDLCSSCTDLRGDGFYIGIADTGLDGGDRAASGTISGEPPSTDLHRAELPKSRIAWGNSFAPTSFSAGQSWSNCGTECPDTTQSKHDTYGHGTMVAGVASGDPLTGGSTDPGGFLLGLGVAPSAGLFITKVSVARLTSDAAQVRTVTRDARTAHSTHAYWQNFGMNQYRSGNPIDCGTFYDGGYTLLSRDFDQAVRDADNSMAGDQAITLAVSSGNIDQQLVVRTRCTSTQPILTLPPATAKNVLSIGGGENVQPEPWLCRAGTRSDNHDNLAMNAKHGTKFAGWYKPDLIAVSSNIASTISSDASTAAPFCAGVGGEPSIPSSYRASSGTSFAAPAGAAAAALASRRYSSDPAAATPALVKAMLIAGSKSMRAGTDRAWLRRWRYNSSDAWMIGDRVIPTTPNGHFYEVETVGTAGYGIPNPTEPLWPTDGGTVGDGFGTRTITWRDKGLESDQLAIPHFPNSQQGFGRIALDDVLSDYPMRAYVNETQSVSTGGSWSAEYLVHDLSFPVRVALVWTDPPAMWTGGGAIAPTPPLVNDLDLSIQVIQDSVCVGRYVGNDVNTVDESSYQSCTGGVRDSKNNVEVARFFASSSRGDTRFTVRVDFPSGTSSQKFALVIWNAYSFDTVTPPPLTPTLDASGTSPTAAGLTWTAANGATTYEIQRSAGLRDAFATIATLPSSTTSYIDGGRTAATSYLYRVRARNATGVSDWSTDPATTIVFSDSPLLAGTVRVKAEHITQVRNAVAALRVLAELSPVTWTDEPLVAGTTRIRAVHITELRSALNGARVALDLPAISFTDGTLPGGTTVIRRVHVQELRDGL